MDSRNKQLARTIRRLGTVTVAYHTHRSVPTVYRWLRAGGIADARDLLTVYRLAHDAGMRIALDDLTTARTAS